MLTLISINVLDIKLRLIDMDCFHHRSGGTGRNVIIFGVDVSSSIKIDSRKKDILISWQNSYTKIGTCTVCRKNIFY